MQSYSTAASSGVTSALSPPVIPARVGAYLDRIVVVSKTGLRNEACKILKCEVRPHIGRPDVKRVRIQNRYKRFVRIVQPTEEDLTLLDSIVPEASAIYSAEIALDFFPKHGETEALDRFLRQSLAFESCLDYMVTHPVEVLGKKGRPGKPAPPKLPPGKGTIYWAPNVKVSKVAVTPKYYSNRPSKLDPAGPPVPHLCIRLNAEMLADLDIRRPVDLLNFFRSRARQFFDQQMTLINSDLERLRERARGLSLHPRFLHYLFSDDPDHHNRLMPGQETLARTRSPILPPELYDKSAFLPAPAVETEPVAPPPPITFPKKPRKRPEATTIRRGRRDAKSKRLNDTTYEAVLPMLPDEDQGRGRPREHSPRELLDAMIERGAGVLWNRLSLSRPTVARAVRRWREAHVWQRIEGAGLDECYPELLPLRVVLGEL